MRVERPKRPKQTKREVEDARGPLVFTPHAGAQAKYFGTDAKIIIAGGGAGGGKTMSLLMEPLQGLEYVGFSAAMFRKTLEMHRVSGGLRAESLVWYKRVPGSDFNATELNWHFDDQCSIKFYGCDKVTKFDGLQAAYLGVDQVEQLTADEFWHLCSRVRSTAKHKVTGEPIKVKIRATCNPEPGWLEKFLKSGGYVGKNGLPVKKMDGVVRWFVRNQKTDEIVWADSLEEFGEVDDDGKIVAGECAGLIPSSFTFIRFPLKQNVSLPASYEAELQNMTIEERRKKLEGNWNLWTGGGGVYRAKWWGLKGDTWVDSPNRCEYLSPEQSRDIRLAWAWDIGWTANSDWTVGILFGQGESCWYVLDMIKFRAREKITFEAVARCAKILEDTEIPVILPRDPGKAGVDQANWQQQLGALGMIAHLCPDDGKIGDKVLRHRFLAPQAEQGRLKVVTDWRPSQAVSFWVSQQTDEGKAVECTTVDGWAMELVQCLDALSHDCPHVVTDVCDGVVRGHRWMTQMDPAGAARMALVMTASKDWQAGDRRIDVARAATSQWSRDRPSHQRATRGDGTDWLFSRRR